MGGGPEPIQASVAASRVGRLHSPYRPAADDTAAGAEPGIVRLA